LNQPPFVLGFQVLLNGLRTSPGLDVPATGLLVLFQIEDGAEGFGEARARGKGNQLHHAAACARK